MSAMKEQYRPLADFAHPARHMVAPSRIVFMLASFAMFFVLTPVLISAVLPYKLQVAYYEGNTTFGTLLLFASFGPPAAAFVWTLRRVHGRGFWSLIGDYQTAFVDFKKVAIAVGLTLIALEILPPWVVMDELARVRSIPVWLLLWPMAFVAVLVQATTEELIFRGYLQQQLACLSSSRWAWMVLPSLLFGMVHYWNGNSPPEGVVYVIFATALGLVCADLTARTGTLGAAIGLHLVVNLSSLMFTGVEGWANSGLALFLYPYEDPDTYSAFIAQFPIVWGIGQLLFLGLVVLIVWLAARVALRR